MCYTNTIVVQNVLSDSKKFALFTKENLKVLVPLFL